MLVALGWRLHNIGFGLPSMYDPDEPIFMITALKMLAERHSTPTSAGRLLAKGEEQKRLDLLASEICDSLCSGTAT